jgi:hypothetical protein
VAVTRHRQPFRAQKLDVEKLPTKSDDVQMRVMKSVFVFGKFERPSSTLKKLFPKCPPLQFGESVFDSLCRLLSSFDSMRLGQNKMNRLNVVMSQKRSHHRQIFLLKFPRPPPTTIRAKTKLTSKIWNYLRDVQTAR